MSDPLLIDIDVGMTEGVKWAILQRWVKQACINAGISNPGTDPLLSDIDTGDTEGVKFAKLQRWLKALSNGIATDVTNWSYTATIPSTSSSSGIIGQFTYDTSYLYVCVATNTWRRMALDDWS